MENLKISPQSVNPLALQVCQVLRQAGFQSFIVGGCVRDLILGVKPKDWDITTDANPQQVIDLFPKTIPTGLQHGTITVVLGDGIENHFEVTTFRVEGEYKDGRRPEEVFFVKDIVQDLARRDLTINAMAFDPIEGKLIDPFHGENDLQNKIIRAVGNPIDRFNEDGLRIMRAARFAARFGYTVEFYTLTAMSECLDTLSKVSKERIKDELCKTLMTDHASVGFDILLKSGVLNLVCPVLTSKPYYTIMIRSLSDCHGDLETKVAMLYGNCPLIKEMEQELITLKFSNKEVKQIVFLSDMQSKFCKLLDGYSWSKKAFKEFIAHVKNHMGSEWEHTMDEFIKLMEPIGFWQKKQLSQYREVSILSKKEMNIDGNDLIALGVKPGPQIKIILEQCYQEVLHNPENNSKEFLLSFCLDKCKSSSMSSMQ